MHPAHVADALGVVRIVLALALPWALAGRGGWLPLALALGAAVTDYVDGPLARRGPATRHGALLDTMADGAVVLAGTTTGAALGLLHWGAPLAIAAAFATYVYASRRMSAGGWRPARSRLGHAAGVLNYGAVLVVAGAVALPRAWWTPVLAATSAIVVAANAGAVLLRITTAPAPGLPPRFRRLVGKPPR